MMPLPLPTTPRPPRGADALAPVARGVRAVASASAALLLALAGGTAQAGLFDDDEARKAVVDLRSRTTQIEEQNRVRASELATANAQMTEQLTAVRRSLLDLNNQLEAMRGELAKLRGSDEQLAREVADLQRRQRDTGQVLEDRLRRLEPLKVTVDGRELVVDQEEKRAYDEAVGSIRTGDFDKSVGQLTAFQKRFAGSAYNDSIRFWLGNALYGKRDYKEAIATFRTYVASAPDSPRAPEALLAIANSQAEMKDARGARRTIDELMKSYPKSEAAQAGKERLASIR